MKRDQLSSGITPAKAEGLSRPARELPERADRHHLGREFLRVGHPESVAVIHGVHPTLVHECREWLHRTQAGGS